MTRSDSRKAGERVGHWTLLEKIDNDYWKCRCDCGTVKAVSVYSLYANDTNSCGCEKRKPLEDLTGKQFGSWTVLRYDKKGKWICKCKCGNEGVVRAYGLKTGKSTSCGCERYARASETNRKDLTGKRFGKLTVVSYAGNERWNCVCDCGRSHNAAGGHLRNGHVTSCGCNVKTHGKSNTRLYNIWSGMRQRCNNEGAQAYRHYGGRGIRVCEEWDKSDGFATFYEWAVGSGYKDTLTIDRIDVNGDYSPENCRWATYKDQANNKRNSTFYEVSGENLTVAQAADKYNVSASGLRKRMKKGVELRDAIENILSQKETERYGPRRDHGRA